MRHKLLVTDLLDHGFIAQSMFKRRPDKRRKQRMRIERPGFVFWMKLARQKPWMDLARKLYNLHEFSIGREPAHHQTFTFQSCTKFRIELVTMTVALAYFFGAVVNIPRQRALQQPAWPRTQTHCSSQFLNINQIAQLKDDGMRCFYIELG